MQRGGLKFFFLFLVFVPLQAQEPGIEYKLKAEMLERFTRFIDWPANSGIADSSTPFTIAVIGKNPFGTYLQTIYQNTRIKGKLVRILEASDPEKLSSCEIVFISSSESANLERILQITRNRPILTVGDTPDYAKKGILINFYKADQYIRFEVNPVAVEKSGLKFSSRLMKLAKLVP